MKKIMLLKTFAVFLSFVLACGCAKSKKKEAEEEILAQVGEIKITVKEFQDTINSYTPYLRSKYNTLEMKKKKLEEMVRFELLAMEAKQRGYDKDPMVQRALRQSLIRELLQKEVEDKVKLEDISEEEMRKYYEEHPEKYHKPAQRRLAHILVKDRNLAARVLKESLEDEMNAARFRELVLKYSEDPVNKNHGGDMGYFSAPEERTENEPPIDKKLLEALYSLEKVGEIYKEPVETGEGFHIVKFTSTKPESHRTFDQVRRQIQSILWKEKREEAKKAFVESLRKKARIEINEKLLAEIEIPEQPRHEVKTEVPAPVGTPPVITPPRGPTLTPAPMVTPTKSKAAVPGEREKE